MSLKSTLDKFGIGLKVVLENAGAPPCLFEIGAEHLKLGEEAIGPRQTKPSVTLVPIGAPEIEQWGTMRSPTSRVTPGGVKLPEELAVRDEHVDAYVWTTSLDETEKLLNHFVASCRVSATGHSFKPLATRWSAVNPDDLKRGTYCILRFKTRIPFTFEPQPIASAPFTQSIEGELSVNGVTQSEVETA